MRKGKIEMDILNVIQEIKDLTGLTLVELRDKLKEGKILELPCKVGTPVYLLDAECEGDPYDCYHCCESCGCNVTLVREEKFDTWMRDDIGKTVFLTKEEAEKALKENSR